MQQPFMTVEAFTEGKYADPVRSEDAYAVTGHFAAVIDGATSFNGKTYEGKTTGRMAAEILAGAVPSLDRVATLDQALEHLTRAIADAYRKHGIEQLILNDPSQRFAAAVALYSHYRQEIWLIGDCQALVDGNYYGNEKDVDQYIYGMRSFTLQAMLAAGEMTEEAVLMNDPSWAAVIEPNVRRQYHFQNPQKESRWAYAGLDGTPVYRKGVRCVGTEEAHEIVLATDGYPVPTGGQPTLRLSCDASERALAELNRRDPLCIYENIQAKCNQPGNTSYDDRTYLRLTISGQSEGLQ